MSWFRAWQIAVTAWMIVSSYRTGRLAREVRQLKAERPEYRVILSEAGTEAKP